MKYTMAFAVVAMLVVAGCVGFTALADDAAADDVTISYTVESTTISVVVDSETLVLQSPEDVGLSIPDGKTFRGWNVGDDATTVYVVGSTITASDGLKIVAVLADVAYTLTIDGVSIEADDGNTFTIPDADVRDGTIFVGYESADGTVYQAGEVTLTADLVLTSTYKDDVVVSFVADGVTIASGYTADVTVPEDPAKEGYAFAGWEADGVVYATVDAAVFAALDADAVFTAVWAPETLTVTFVGADGEVVLTQAVLYGDTAVEPKTVPTMEGYDFAGWDYDFSTPVTSDVVIVATWTEHDDGGWDATMWLIVIVVVFILLLIIVVLIWQRRKIRASVARLATDGRRSKQAKAALAEAEKKKEEEKK